MKRLTRGLFLFGLGFSLVVAGLVAGLILNSRNTTVKAQGPAPRPFATPIPGGAGVGFGAGADARRIVGRIGRTAGRSESGAITGRITDAATGNQLWEQGSSVPMQPASTNKTLTAAAALLTLDRDARVTTRVVAADQTAQPGTVVLVGGGDPTLSAAPAGEETWYRGAARISDLADQVRRSGLVPTAVQVDGSLYSGPDMAPGWDPADIDGGDIAPMQAVMLDAGRIQPTTDESRRSTTPALDAGRALAVALGVNPAAVTFAPGPPAGAAAGGGPVGAVDGASASDDESVRQRDG